MDWSWAVEGILNSEEEVPRTTGPECINYMTNRRRWIEAIFFTIFFVFVIRWAVKRLDPIILPDSNELNKPHAPMRLFLLIAMTFVFGMEMGFKFAGKSVLFVLNPCHIQTLLQIYLLASKPSKTTIALFRIQMNNLNGPFLAFLFPEVESRTLPFEQATYWIQHLLLYIIPVYILRTGMYTVEDFSDYNWVAIGVANMLIYHFVILNGISMLTYINMNHMLCPALADPFQGENYRIAAVIHESILCPILNKVTVLIFSNEKTYSYKASACMSIKLPSQLNLTSQSNKADEQYYQQMQQQEIIEHKQKQQHLNESTSTIDKKQSLMEMSLADEMAADTIGQTSANSMLIHRIKSQQHQHHNDTIDCDLMQESEMPPTAMTADYSIPTTKID